MRTQMSYETWLVYHQVEPETENCTECEGEGVIVCSSCENEDDCSNCHGSGKLDRTKYQYQAILTAERNLLESLARRKEELEPCKQESQDK